jgi:hypothetical protein
MAAGLASTQRYAFFLGRLAVFGAPGTSRSCLRPCTLYSAQSMAPRTRPRALEVQLPPNVREGMEEALRGEVADMSREEAERYLETGELPERVQRWLGSNDSHDAI